MLKSMTAYARASTEKAMGRIIVEIQSVNRKFLEVNTLLPQELLSFDTDVKKWVGESITRGQINFKLFVNYENVSPVTIKPNMPLVRQIKDAWGQIAKELNVNEPFKLDLLLQEKGILLYTEEFGDKEEYKLAIHETLSLALNDLIKMKKVEGANLAKDISQRIDHIYKLVEQIEVLAPNATKKLREKLLEKMNEVHPGFIEHEDRILREVCLFAEKVDIAEEITRLKSHLNQFTDLLNKDLPTVGKTLEFIVQEMNRETNTIGSKASEVEVSKLVIEMKSEIERIREQIQNVE